EEENQTLSSEEVLSLAVLVLFGGAETTTNLIGNAVLALLDNPDELAKVRANPTLVPNLVEEALRYEAPVQLFPRRTTQEVEVAGTVLPAETVVVALFGSANHDESKFPQPERFDILRNADGHLAFGFGIHFCLGAQLARLEARVALEMLLEQFPYWSRSDAPIRRLASSVARGIETLPLVVKAP
ncbi:MAG: cytochrome P450, partial [Candidatus Binatia bacterium]